MKGLLLSGGMDSIALAWWLRPEQAITVDYGQLAAIAETRTSRQVCEELGIGHTVIEARCPELGSGDMAGDAPDGAEAMDAEDVTGPAHLGLSD